jgi:hypothetical protein
MDEEKFRKRSAGLLSMLGIQFILGMILNLFVKLPKNVSLGSDIKHGGVVLVLHILIAIGLLIGSLALVARSIAAKNQTWTLVSIAGALGVIAALTNGLAFLGNSNDVNSFVMAIGFMVAATSYSVGLSIVAHPAVKVTYKMNRKQQPKNINGRIRHSHG